MDAANGKPLAIIDGEHLTALRTGAASGLATDLLARKDSETVAVFGAGVQGRTQLEAICNVRNIKRCLLFDKLKETARDFEKDMSRVLEIYIEMPDSLGALRDADIICTATNSLDPVFADSDVGDGTHINAIGGYTPDMSEIPPSTLARSKIVVGSRSACLSEAGDILKAIELGAITESNIYAELGEIVDQNKDGRITEREITLFKSVGNAIQDLVCADQILKNANSKMLGIQLEL
jgi:ornithine cyclodeaminase/alanine dehydrogenase-like protein (mu-crystallin family)